MGGRGPVEQRRAVLVGVILCVMIIAGSAVPAGAGALGGAGGAEGHRRVAGSRIDDPWRDDFADGRLVREQMLFLGVNTTGGTRQPCEPRHAGTRGGSSMWFRWRSAEAGTVFLNTNGSEFDSVLAVYTGTDLCALTEVASDNDSGAGTSSRLSFTAGAGRVYRIVVDDRRGRSGYGNFRLRRE